MPEPLDLHLAIAAHAHRRLARRTGTPPPLTIAQIAAATSTTPHKIRTIEHRARLHLQQALRRAGLTQEALEALRHHRHAADQRN